MLIYDALKRDHDNLKGLLEELVNAADSDDRTRKRLIEQVRDEMVPHARAEEKVLYDSLRTIDVAKDLVMHSFGEHAEAEALLRSLQMMEFVRADWTKTARQLQQSVEHHIREEEGKIFSACRQLFIDEEARAMAEVFERLKPEAREGSFVQNTLDMIANMMPQRFAGPFRNITHRT
jgi:hemerythrin superfamily protein